LSVSSPFSRGGGAKYHTCFFKRCSPWFTCPFTPNRNFPMFGINSDVTGKYLNLGSEHFKLKNQKSFPLLIYFFSGGSGGNAFLFYVFENVVTVTIVIV